MNTLKVLGGFTLGLAAAALIGCGTPAATGTPAVATTSPAEATGLPVVVSTPLQSQPGGSITTAETPIPSSQAVGVTGGGVVVAGTAVVITALPGGGPTAILATPQGVPPDVLTVTRDDNGKTITLQVGQTFLLYLDTGQMTWTVTIEDQAIVTA